MTKRGLLLFALLLLFSLLPLSANPMKGLLERIDKGASTKFIIELSSSPIDFFELDQKESKIVVRGNNYISVATGINWYLKYHAGIHLSWNGLKAKLPKQLPAVAKRERHETKIANRYYLNYCTFSYSMAFWDWERWEQEIDWMALHGINMPLALTGTEAVWYNLLKKMGYDREEINQFIAGPAFLAWWHMNNLEGWGGPNSEEWYNRQIVLMKKIIARMTEYGIKPVLPGYAGMVPRNAKEKMGLNIQDPGTWCGFPRPAFLQTSDPRFDEIADLYYAEMNALFGPASYYGIDPFHEGGSTKDIDLKQAGKAIMAAMKRCNPNATWVIQAWQRNPHPQLIDSLKRDDLLVLDLCSEARPQWGDPQSTWHRKEGFGKHNWAYCLLLNFGGNVGMYGKMERLIDGFYLAKNHERFGETLKGVGATPEGIENNPVMYELLFELPWRSEKPNRNTWLAEYTKARYGKSNPSIDRAWSILAKTVYGPPFESTQEGCSESILCARPAESIHAVSSWGSTRMAYEANELLPAVELMLKAAPLFKGNNNFEYDLVDIVRQTLADRAKWLHKEMIEAYKANDKTLFRKISTLFLELILDQDRLLATRSEFMVGTWIAQARSLGKSQEEKDWLEWNARTLITVWGDENGANKGGLRDYSHREWSGILKSLYYQRWDSYINYLNQLLENKTVEKPNYYPLEVKWTEEKNSYPTQPQGDPIEIAQELYRKMTVRPYALNSSTNNMHE